MLKKSVILFLLIQTTPLLSQNSKEIDSILNLIKTTKVDTIKASNYIELSKLYRFKYPKKTLEYAKEALKIYQNTNNHNGLAKAYFYQTSYYNSIGKLDSARYFTHKNIEQLLLEKDTISAAGQTSNIAYFELADDNIDRSIQILDSLAPIFEKFKDSSKLGHSYIVKSQAYSLKGYPNLTLDATQKALKFYRALKDDRNIAQSLLIIGDQYQGENDHEKAIMAFKEALELYKHLNNDIFVAQTLSYIGDSYLGLHQFDEAERYLTEALKLSKSLNFNANIGRTYLNLGSLKIAQKNYDSAIQLLSEGLEIYQSLNIPYNETRALFYLGQVYFEKGMYKKSIEYLDKSISISKQIEDTARLKDALYYKSLALEKIGDTKSALQAYKESKVLSDSIFNIENRKKTSELQIIYETEKREKELLLQKNKIDILEKDVQINNLQKLLLEGGLILSLIAIGFGLYGFRQKVKRSRLEKDRLNDELNFKKKELTSQALHLAKKNELLELLKSKAKTLKSQNTEKKGYQELISAINFDLQDDKNWEHFNQYFEQAYKGFNKRIKNIYPKINENDLRLIALLKMNLSNKEIASILNISPDGVKKARYRVRKKLNLSTEDSLEQILLSL